MTRDTTDAPHRPDSRLHPRALPQLAWLALGPAAWITQLSIDYGLASHACYPRDTALQTAPPPGWNGETGLLLAINLVCLAVAAAGLLLSLVRLRRASGGSTGDFSQVVDPREASAFFLATCGSLAGLGFVIAILADTVAAIGTPTCWSMGS